jgi:hypothetical protein
MLWTICFMLLLMGDVRNGVAYTSGGLVHFLLALAFGLVAIQWINGRRRVI